MQEIEMHNTNGITFLAVAEVGGKTYFSAWYHNGIFRLHKDGTTEFIMLFDKYGDESPRHEFAFAIKDTIAFVSSRLENGIVLFFPEEKKVEYLDYPVSQKNCTYRPFWGYVSRNDTTYLLPGCYDAVLAFNQEDKTFCRYVLPVEKDAFCEEASVIVGGVTVDETVYFCPWNCSEIISFNLKNFEYKVLGKVQKKVFRHMFYIDRKIILVPRILGSGLLVYDIQDNSLTEKEMPSMMQGICICAFADERGNLYFLPHGEGKVWIWNPVSDTLDMIELKISNGDVRQQLYFNETRDLWGGKIIFTDYETLSHLLFDGREIKPFDINKKQGLFLDILKSMADNHTGAVVYEY